MKLEKIVLNNFLTYKGFEYNFTDKPVMVQGRNLTDDKQKSNGSGKSGLQTGIEFCITASNSRGVNDSELVMFGESEANAELLASCDIRKERIHIDWTIKKKGSNKLTLTKQSFEGEWEEISFSTVNDGKKYILNWFAISKEDLFNYFIINKTRFKSFFKSSNKEKVDLINRFSDASIIDGIEQIDNTALESEHGTQEREIYSLEGKLQLTKENLLKELNRDFESEFEKEKEKIESEIDDAKISIGTLNNSIELGLSKIKEEEEKISQIDVEINEVKKLEEPILNDIKVAESELNEICNDIESAKELVLNFSRTNWEDQRSSLKSHVDENNSKKLSLKEKFSEYDSGENKIARKLNEISVALSGSITCPSCKHEFILDGDIDELKQKSKSLIDLKGKFIEARWEVQQNIELIKNKISEYENSISEINSRESKENNEVEKLRQSVHAVEDKLRAKQGEIDRLNKKLKRNITDEIEDLKSMSLSCESNIERLNISKLSRESKIQIKLEHIALKERDIKSLVKGSNESVIKGHKFEISVYEKDIESRKVQLNELGDKIYQRNKWASNFKNFKMHVANQSLEVMEYHTNRFLSSISENLSVKYDGFKVLSNGTIKEEITAKIFRENERTFYSFSGGEQGRLLFSSILANRFMINETHPYGGLDFLSVDEVFEGVDSAGLRELLEAAKQLGVCCMFITHVTDEQIDEDILLIEKVNGISKIVNK